MNNQQFIMLVFGSISALIFGAMGAMLVFERRQDRKQREGGPAAEAESRPRSAE